MKKKNILITAGGTSENIDKVRKITNSGTGKLWLTIANELLKTKYDEIDTIYYVCSINSLRPIDKKVEIIEIGGTVDLKNAVETLLKAKRIDYFIHSMAVSDYMVNYVTNANLLAQSINNNSSADIEDVIKNNTRVITDNKISSNEDNLILVLKPTPKVISLIKPLSPKTFLIGFKLLDGVSRQELVKVATKLRDKNDCDLVVANDLEGIRQGNHDAIIIDRNDNQINASGKQDIAEKLVGIIYGDKLFNV